MMCPTEADSSPQSLPAAPPPPEPIYFGPPARRLFGWYHAPPPAARNRAVVLCAPLGHEALHTHAAYRYLAEQLAAAGFAALRFDYDGTGDSAGSDDDEGRVGHWLESIGFAIDTLRQFSAVESVSLFGVRMGATLAAVAAAERGDITELLLWAPCRSGRLWQREMRVLQAARGPQQAREDTGEEEAGGFVYTRPTAEALEQLDAVALLRKPADTVLLVSRDDLPEDTRLAKSLTALGAAVIAESWPGYAAMMRDPQDCALPVTAAHSLVGWLLARTHPAPPTAPASPARGTLTHAAYTEEAVFWNPAARRFGILTRPCVEGPRQQTGVVLLNVGANSHIGPNRMWVTLARELATLGFPVLRLDTEGLGDSACGAVPGRQQLYRADAVTDVRAALSFLEAQTSARQFTLIGLCSGAYTASLTAYEDPRVTGQVLINSQALDWNEGDTLEVLMRQSYKPTTTYVSSLRDPDVWKRVLHSQVDVKGITHAVGQRLAVRGGAALGSLLSLVLGRAPAETPAARRLRAASVRGVDTLFLFAAEDAGLELTLLHLGTTARRLTRLPGTHLTVIDNADHTFTPKSAREEMLSHITRHLQARFPAA